MYKLYFWHKIYVEKPKFEISTVVYFTVQLLTFSWLNFTVKMLTYLKHVRLPQAKPFLCIVTGCPKGWFYNSPNCYKFVQDSQLIYEEAAAACTVSCGARPITRANFERPSNSPYNNGYPETTNATDNNKRTWYHQVGIGCKYLSENNLTRIKLIRGKLFPAQALEVWPFNTPKISK